ncbi:hypothetical protein BMS3Bbin01_01155 [bacterium BMS3Bbin01]|nr:hypothetical protein BMS3Bbin01_01155 [bacterium BMS3Bbin01]
MHFHGPATDLVHHRDGGRLADLLDGHTCRLELFGAQPVTGDVDDIVDSTKDPEVTVGCLDGAVARQIRPVAPVLAVFVPAVPLVVDLDESVGLFPDRLEDARPRVADADVPGPAASGLDSVVVVVVDHRVDSEDPRAAAARLHRLEGRQRAAEEAAVLGLPPGVDDDRFSLADDIVVPAPDVGFDRFADRRHVLEVVVVLLRFLRAELAQHPDRRRGGMKDVHAEPLGDPPWPARVRICGGSLVQHARRPERQRTVDDVGVTGDPPDVREAPVGVLGVDVLVVLRRAGHVGQISAGAVLAPFGARRRTARVHEEQRGFCRHRDRVDHPPAIVRKELVDEEVPSLDHRALRRVLAGMSPPDEHLVDLDAAFVSRCHRLVGFDLVVDQLAVAVVAVHRHQDVALRVGDTLPTGLTAESAEDLGMDGAETGAGEHGDRQFGDHRHVERHPVTDLDATEAAQESGELVDTLIELLVGDHQGVFGLRLGHPDESRLVAAGREVAVDAVVGGVQSPTDEPLPMRRVTRVERRVPIGVPAEQVGVLLETLRKMLLTESLEDLGIRAVRLRDELRRGVVILLLTPMNGDL